MLDMVANHNLYMHLNSRHGLANDGCKRENFYLDNIGRERQPFLTYSIQSTNKKRTNGNNLGNENQDLKGFGWIKMFVGEEKVREGAIV